MKLILSSDVDFIFKYGYELTGIPKEQIKIGYITTAAKCGKGTSVNKRRIAFQEHGLNYEEIDIEAKNPIDLKRFFEDKNIIHVEGGNAFYLIKAIRESGFDELLKELILNKIYIGDSAAAYVVCPTIEVADWNETGRDRHGVTDFSGLNYVPFLIKAHFTDDQAFKIKSNMKNISYPIKILRDGQAILVENDKYTLCGAGEEVNLV